MRRNCPQVLTAYYLTLAAIGISSLFPELRLWGLSWYGYIPATIGLPILAAAFTLPDMLRLFSGRSTNLQSRLGAISWPVTLTGLTVVFAALFVLLRNRTHFLGDGYLLLSRLTKEEIPIRPWNWGAYFAQENLYRILGQPGESSALLTFQVLSYASGLFFVLVCGLAAARLYKSNRDRFLFVTTVSTAGYMLLFFGYVENYPIFIALVGATVMVGLLVADQKLPRWILVPPVVVAALLHPFALALLPGVVYLLLRSTFVAADWKRVKPTYRVILMITVSLAALAGGYVLYSGIPFIWFSLVPLYHNRFTVEGYTLLSAKHLLDIANLTVQLFPGWLLLVAVLFLRRGEAGIRTAKYRFLLLLLLGTFLIVFLVDPKLGMPRDWDLYAMAGIPLAVLGVVTVLDREWQNAPRRSIVVLMLALNLGLLGPRVYTQLEPSLSIALFDNYADLDKAKSRSGRFVLLKYLQDQGKLTDVMAREFKNARDLPHFAWSDSARALSDAGLLLEARALFNKVVEHDPTYYVGWSDLGVSYLNEQRYDSAIICLEIADGMNPFNSGVYENLGLAYFATDQVPRALVLWQRAVKLDPDNIKPRLLVLGYYKKTDQPDAYYSLLAETADRPNAPLQVLSEQARHLLLRGDFDGAANYYRRALDKGLDSAEVRELCKEYPRLDILDAIR